jgi:uncharacterized glyoxalase superfamily protein PhnB
VPGGEGNAVSDLTPSERPKNPPEGQRSVTPCLVTRSSTRLIAFLAKAFGAEETARVPNSDGSIAHAEVRIGDSVVMLFDSRHDWPESPAFVRLYVDDADAVFKRALDAGAMKVTEVTHLAFGDRVGRVRDPFGNLWWIQTRVEKLSPEAVNRRMAEPKWSVAMRYVQESLAQAMRARR